MSHPNGPDGASALVADPARLSALDAYAILDTVPEEGFEDVVRLATRLCAVPVALVSFVAVDRQWFKARVGFPSCETDLNSSVCKFVLAEPDLLVIPDLAADPRTRGNPLVTGEPGIRFYAGAPLRTPEGHALGSICVIDTEPRPGGLSPEQADDLRALARQVSGLMALRRAVARRDEVLDRQNDELIGARRVEVLASATAALLAAGDPAAVLDPILAASAGALGFDRSYTYDVWPDGRHLRLTHALNATEEVQAHLHKMPYGAPLCGLVAESRRPLVLADVQLSEVDAHQMARGIGLNAYAGFPVTSRGSLRGVISFASTRSPAFDAETLAFFATIARLMSVAYERRDGEAALGTSETEMRLVIESAKDHAILTTDPEGTVTSWSAGAQAAFGWEPDEIVGRSADVLFTPEDRADGVPARELSTAGRAGCSNDERWHLTRGGERVFMNGSVHPLPRDADGRERGFIKIVRDETSRRGLEEALRESNARFRTIIDTVEAAFAIVEVKFDADDQPVDYRFVEANPAFERQAGVNLRGKWVTEFAPDLERFWFETYGRVALTGEPATFESYAEAFKRWFDVRAVRVGRPEERRIAILFSDVTARKQAEGALAASEAHWRGLFERLSEGFIVGEVVRDEAARVTDWRYLDVNAAWGGLVGVDPARVAGRTIREVFPGIEDAWVREFADVVETGRPVAFTRQVSTLRRWYDGRAFPLGSEQFGVLFLEVTARVEADARRDALLELGEVLRDINEVPALVEAAAGVLARATGATRAGYGVVDPERETVEVLTDWQVPGSASVAGLHGFRTYGTYIEDLRRGEVVAIDDVTLDPRTQDTAGALLAIGVRVLLNVPILERGRLVGIAFVHWADFHPFTEDDLAFVRTVADRVQTAVARVQAEEGQRVLNEEISHRLKNTLAMVLSVATQTLRSVPDRAPVEAFESRIHALSRAHDVLLRQTWAAAPAKEVVRAVLAGAGHADRIDVSGPDLDLGPRATLSLSLLLHELSTNAAKYGALSVPEGRVAVDWRLEGSDGSAQVTLDWTERGGPVPAPPASTGRKGFGSRIIGLGLAGTGGVDLRYPASGFEATMRAPLVQLQQS